MALCRRRHAYMATRLDYRAALVGLLASLAAGKALGQTDKPRFVVLLDNSTSMTENLDVPAIQTHGPVVIYMARPSSSSRARV